jgi:hypothetical protein
MQKDETSSIPHGGAKIKPTLTDNLPPTKHREFKPFPWTNLVEIRPRFRARVLADIAGSHCRLWAG